METDWKHFRDLATEYKRAHDFKMTVTCLKRSLELIPDSLYYEKALLKNSLAFYYSECHDYSNAEILAREAAALELAHRSSGPHAKSLGEYYLNLSVILEKQERWSEASMNAEKAIEVFNEVLGKEHPFTKEKAKFLDYLKGKLDATD